MDLVFTIRNAITDAECNEVISYIRTRTTPAVSSSDMPWHDGNSVSWENIQDSKVKRIVTAYKYKLCQIAANHYGELVYPNFTDMVLWVPGKSMMPHTDDGQLLESAEYLRTRKYTAVLYLNDDFVGGETFVLNEQGERQFFKPVKGTALVMTSDKRCMHGVNILTSGLRYTLAVWMTVNPADCEV